MIDSPSSFFIGEGKHISKIADGKTTIMSLLELVSLLFEETPHAPVVIVSFATLDSS